MERIGKYESFENRNSEEVINRIYTAYLKSWVFGKMQNVNKG